MRIGILGTGHLSGFVCQGLRATGWQGAIEVSPYSAASAAIFVERFDANLAQSNNQMLKRCEIVLVAVRPQQFKTALVGLDWPKETVLLSAMAGVQINQIQALVGDCPVVRAMPVSAAEIAQSPTTMFPDHADVRALLESIGTVIALPSEAEFEMATVNAAAYGWYFALIDELVKANVAAGLSEQKALEVVTGTLTAAAAVATKLEQPLDQFLQSLATPGGITAEGLAELTEKNAVSHWTGAFNRVAKRLRRSS